MTFGGETYDPKQDERRLKGQALAVFTFLKSHVGWHSLADLRIATGHPEASISARLRDFRKRSFGSHTIEARRHTGGLWVYRLAETKSKETQKSLFDTAQNVGE